MNPHRDIRLSPLPRPAPFEGNRAIERIQNIGRLVSGIGKNAIQGFRDFADVVTASSQHDLDYPSTSFTEHVAQTEETALEDTQVSSLGWQRKP